MRQLNIDPPLCLRVNRQKQSREQWLELLDDGAQAHALGEPSEVGRSALGELAQQDAVVLEQNLVLADLPGHEQGAVSVQGASAQAAASLMDLQAGHSVLDACAAPGGKTAHMLELEPQIVCTAMDLDGQRMQRVEENLQRLGLSAQCMVGDVMQSGPWVAEYDRILLDAPCTGSGVIGRHPDIKWLRRAGDLETLSAQQLAMLQRLWGWLKPGGVLLYCTCSILTAENDAVIEAFMATQSDARCDALNLPFGQASAYGWRVAPQLPYEGFYFSRLIKA